MTTRRISLIAVIGEYLLADLGLLEALPALTDPHTIHMPTLYRTP